MDKKYLAVDLGASSGRAIVGSYNGSRLVFDEAHRFENKPVKANDTIYWDILYLFLEAKVGLSNAISKYKKIESMAIDTWGVDFGLIDLNGKLISNPVSYRDPSKYIDKRKEFYSHFPKEKLFEITAVNPILTISALFYLYNMKLNNLHGINYAKKFLMMPDLFNYFFTGICRCEFTVANNSMMLNWKNNNWDKGIINYLGLSKDLFPEVIMNGKKIGKLTKQITKELEIGSMPVVSCASHDTTSGVAGIPAGSSNNWAFISAGTWCVMGIETENPITDKNMLNTTIINEGCASGRNIIAKNLTGFWIIQKCRQKWAKDNNDLKWDKIVGLAKREKPFTSFIDIDDPRFARDHDNMPDIIRKYCIETNQKPPKNMGQIARCIYESMVLRFRLDLKLIEKLSNKEIEVIHIIGGGVKNQLICQWTANVVGKLVIAGPVETTAIGNIIMQLMAAGEIKDISEGRKISKNSSSTVIYEPKDRSIWESIYYKYINVINNKI